MSRLADPMTCPDCRARVSDRAVCTGCGLVLTGPLASELWRTMVSADQLVERIRAEVRAPTDVSAASAPAGPAPSVPAAAPRPAPAVGLTGRAVPAVLLALGGLFVFVAVGLFLAVTWQVLPLAVKALLMLAVTTGIGAGATVLTRRGLRGSAEALWALTAALLALDVSAAHRSGLAGLGALSDSGVTTLIGLLLAGLGLGAGALAVRSSVRRVLAAEITLLLGLLAVVVAQVWTGRFADGPAEAVAVPLLVAVAYAVRRAGLHHSAYAVVGLAGMVWATLAATGVDPAIDGTRAAFWSGFGCWPLALAAAYAAVVASAGRLALVVRVGASAAAFVCLSLLVLLPPSWSTLEVLLLAAVVVALAAVVRLAPVAWAFGAGLVGGVLAAACVVQVVGVAVVRVLAFVDEHPGWDTPVRTAFPVVDGPVLWTVVALAAAALVFSGAARRFLPALAITVEPPVVLAVAALALATGVSGGTLPLWVVAGAFGLAAVAAVVAPAVDDEVPVARVAALAVGALSALLALGVASRTSVVMAVVAGGLAVTTASVFLLTRRERDLVPAVMAAVTVVLAGLSGWATTLATQARPEVGVDVVVAVACLALLAAAHVAGHALQRFSVEIAGGVVAAAAIQLALDDNSTLAVALTVVGTTVALVSVIHRDRVHLGWVGSVVLACSTVVRLGMDTRLGAEVYTLPAAAVLIGAGVVRLLAEPRLSTWRVLGSGLSLAFVPSLLIALDEPNSLRALLVGLGGVVALVLGIERRWQAPFLAGSAVLTVLALRFLLPVAMDVLADPLGAWMLFGTVGALCLAGGILWERSLANLRIASRYVAALR